MSGGDGMAAAIARRIQEEQDRIRENHERRRKPVPKVYLTREERKLLRVNEDVEMRRASFRIQQILWLAFWFFVAFVIIAQCAHFHPLR